MKRQTNWKVSEINGRANKKRAWVKKVKEREWELLGKNRGDNVKKGVVKIEKKDSKGVRKREK